MVHWRIFGEEMSDEMRNFLGHLSWSFFGGFVAAGIMLILTIIAGRLFGPDAFGQYNSLLSFAIALSFFFLLGNNSSSVRYLSDKKYENNKKEILTTSALLVLFQVIIIGFIFFIFFNFIKTRFLIGNDILIIGFFFSFILAIKNLMDGYLRSFSLIRKQSIIRIFDSIIALSSFILFYNLQKTEYYFYAISVSLGAVFFIGTSFFFIFGNFGKFNFRSVKLLFHYNKFLMIGSLGGTIISLEKYFIGKYIGMYELGIYSAYYAASFLIIANLGSIFMNVFLPNSIKEKENMHIISKKMNMLFLRVFPFWIIFGTGFVSLMIIFMGKGYPLNIYYAFLIEGSSFLAFVFSTFISLLNIDHIKESVLISTICYIFIIISIILFRNILYYLVSQMCLYFIFYLIAKKRLLANMSF